MAGAGGGGGAWLRLWWLLCFLCRELCLWGSSGASVWDGPLEFGRYGGGGGGAGVPPDCDLLDEDDDEDEVRSGPRPGVGGRGFSLLCECF